MSTIVDVARMANVSRATVTRVLNEPEKVKEETKLRVENAIRLLNYKPNLSARSLVSKSSGVIGMLIPNNVSGFFGSVMSAVHKEVNAKGKMLMVLESAGQAEEENALRKLDEINCDGFLLYTRHLSTETIKAYTENKPVVLLDASGSADIHSVSFDHYLSAFDATNKLIAAGHKKIAVIGGPDSRYSASQRLKGCIDAIRAVNKEWGDEYYIQGSYDHVFGEKATLTLIERKLDMTAIVYCGERACSGGLKTLRLQGLSVPDDISVISFDSFGLTEYLAPHIDSVVYPVKEMAEYGAREILMKLTRKDYVIQSRQFPHSFIEGQSISQVRDASR
ncbi:LacI family DNA-binding transcriptional regulator [Pectobacterium carotovorum]|uniref:LacI family DNA-binding transcriptional regulator n=1 Tax=Pectobacterium carotovorum TaxID=554 RepID=UPI0015DD8EF0|nr:LacI family DNA-binding transcriptional regulator [Pectobacterium carotovorum]MBA0176607.1 LacI family DNA-binding transcriptional regulator [Pectobacterium carotovorum]